MEDREVHRRPASTTSKRTCAREPARSSMAPLRASSARSTPFGCKKIPLKHAGRRSYVPLLWRVGPCACTGSGCASERSVPVLARTSVCPHAGQRRNRRPGGRSIARTESRPPRRLHPPGLGRVGLGVPRPGCKRGWFCRRPGTPGGPSERRSPSGRPTPRTRSGSTTPPTSAVASASARWRSWISGGSARSSAASNPRRRCRPPSPRRWSSRD